MPHVINGIGTWYWGKHRIHALHAACQYCGHVGELLSYDTRTYFVVLFVPIIPLGRKRVIEECQSCKRHAVVGYRDWQQKRERDLPEAVEAFRVAPRERERAIRALDLVIACQDDTALDDMATIIDSSLSRDAEVRAAIGDAYAYFSRIDAAESAYRSSLKVEDRGEVRDSLARILLLQSRPDEAWALISKVLTEEGACREGLALLVAESYQAWGMHDAAKMILDATISAFPQLEKDPDYRKLRKSARKYQGTSKRLKPKLLTSPKRAGSRGSTFGRYVSKTVAAVILLVIVSGYAIASHQAADDRLIHVVNGLSVPYSVSINGQTRKLRPQSVSRIRIAEGDINVSVIDETVPIPDQNCLIRTNFFTRLFVEHTFVINPDRTALFVWEETEYSEHPGPGSDYSYGYYCGEFVLSWTGVDYPFQEFPETLSLSSDSSVRKSRVAYIHDWPVPIVAATLSTVVDHEVAVEYLRRKVELDRDDPLTLGTFTMVAEPDAAIEVLDRLCRERPVRVESHRSYQNVVDLFHPEVDLVEQYRAVLAEAPDDRDHMYLLGRILDDNEEAESLFAKAAAGNAPSARAFGALSYNRLTSGDFEEALLLGERAMEVLPNNHTLRYLPCLALSALGRYDEALSLFRTTDPYIRGSESDEVYYLSRIGNEHETNARIEELARESAEQGDRAAGDETRGLLQSMVAYVQGDLDEAIRLAEPVTDPYANFARAVMMGDLGASRQALDPLFKEKPDAALLLSVVFRDAGNAQEADQLLSLAVELMQAGGSRQRRAASWLSGKSQPEPEEVLRIALDPGTKAIVLVAMGCRYPEHKDSYFQLARTLNFDRRFPYMVIRSLIDGG